MTSSQTAWSNYKPHKKMRKTKPKSRFPKPALNSEPTPEQMEWTSPADEELIVGMGERGIDLQTLSITVVDQSGRRLGTISFKGGATLPLSDFEWTHVVERDERGDLWQ
jgi:hypothetical protein